MDGLFRVRVGGNQKQILFFLVKKNEEKIRIEAVNEGSY